MSVDPDHNSAAMPHIIAAIGDSIMEEKEVLMLLHSCRDDGELNAHLRGFQL